jgi:cell wall-associated NlpC family hydrolase
MSYFICLVPVCPVRAEASHRSEQVSQLLFGETALCIESFGDFIKIRCTYDNYEGWCQSGQLQEIKQDLVIEKGVKLFSGWANEILFNSKSMFVPFGSVYIDERTFNLIGNQTLSYNGSFLEPAAQVFNEETLLKITTLFINTPYLWGGRSVFGIDCSGFTQLVFKCLNIPLLRDASQQATQGDAIGFLLEAKFGDLAFFDNEAGKITHVGILLTANTIIHASGKVRVDTIDNFGIVNNDTGKRTHTLRVIKRMVNQD